MKLIGRRAWILMIICILFFVGMGFFIISYIKEAPTWASSPMNKHIYIDGHLANAGEILDINGQILASSENGIRHYNDDQQTREALMHLVGDNSGSVATSIQVNYRDKLVGWNFLNGVYSFEDRIGENIRTTVDADLARTAYMALNGRKGTVGIMNYKTGDLICMVSSTSFDPSNPPDVSQDPERYDGVYINRLLSAKYAPGSIFKLVTASAAINEISDINTRTFRCSGSTIIEGGEITCMQAHGTQNFTQTMVNSCNVAYAEMAEEIGKRAMTKYAENAGLNVDLSMGNIDVTTGIFDLSNADNLAIAWAGVGQYETLINPLSYLQFVASIANDGKTVSPRVIDSIETAKGRPTSLNLKLPEGSSMDTNTAVALQSMMRACVTDNYGEGGLAGYNMCAKTGTAEVGSENEPHSWFCGYLDSDAAPYAFITIVENGGYGRSAAFDIATKVLQEAVN